MMRSRFSVSDTLIRDEIETHLRRIPDLDRALSRLALDRGGPRDLAAIRERSGGGRGAARGPVPHRPARGSGRGETGSDGPSDPVGPARSRACGPSRPCSCADWGQPFAQGLQRELDEVRPACATRGAVSSRGLQRSISMATGASPSLKIKAKTSWAYFHRNHGDPRAKELSARCSERFIHRQDNRQRRALHLTRSLWELETKAS